MALHTTHHSAQSPCDAASQTRQTAEKLSEVIHNEPVQLFVLHRVNYLDIPVHTSSYIFVRSRVHWISAPESEIGAPETEIAWV